MQGDNNKERWRRAYPFDAKVSLQLVASIAVKKRKSLGPGWLGIADLDGVCETEWCEEKEGDGCQGGEGWGAHFGLSVVRGEWVEGMGGWDLVVVVGERRFVRWLV